MKKILWIRKLSCGHKRPTIINYIFKIYKKPKIGAICYCRICEQNKKVEEVYKLNDN